ncbi:MAG: integral rane sensor signal transduction histidine kinase [Firmicutes bacterium]|nr:integral rane sensor signal transduction histidine kinase [Bacillota bacterium]
MRCPSFRKGKRRPFRRSLYGRLARAFVLIALLTLVVSFMVMYWHGSDHPGSIRIALVALPIAAATGIVLARRIARPLRRLEDAVERLDLKDLSLRVPVEGDDEVSALARAFNRMVERLEAEEQGRRNLFADVAHELRHPLAVLQGRLELIQDGVVPLGPEQVLHLSDMVLKLSALVGDLRDLSLAEVGVLSLVRAPLDLGGLVADVREHMEPVATARQIELVAEVAPDLPPIVADARRIEQVLVNLLSNALHHTPSGGQVAVRAWAEGEEVLLQVSDTGPGIPPEALPHIFDRFYRTDKSRSRTTGGSGLGLAIVRSLVAVHGGSVRVESSPGEGSRFTVSLPRTAPL